MKLVAKKRQEPLGEFTQESEVLRASGEIDIEDGWIVGPSYCGECPCCISFIENDRYLDWIVVTRDFRTAPQECSPIELMQLADNHFKICRELMVTLYEIALPKFETKSLTKELQRTT